MMKKPNQKKIENKLDTYRRQIKHYRKSLDNLIEAHDTAVAEVAEYRRRRKELKENRSNDELQKGNYQSYLMFYENSIHDKSALICYLDERISLTKEALKLAQIVHSFYREKCQFVV